MRRLLLCSLMLAAGAAPAATFVVTNTLDSGAGSLRAALAATITSAPPNRVDFNLPGAGPFVINVGAALPTLTNSLAIRGETQPGYAGTPLVQIAGPPSSGPNYGLYVQGPASTVSAVRVSGFDGGVLVDHMVGGTADHVHIRACVLDQNTNGLVLGYYARQNLVGGTNVSDRNVIRDNKRSGIIVYGDAVVPTPAPNHRIWGNFIGVSASGATASSNAWYGIELDTACNNWILGGSNFPQVISGHGTAGIRIADNTTNTVVEGNLIGCDVTGTLALPNLSGVSIENSYNNRVGGTNAAARNVVSGNRGEGVVINGGLARNNVVIGNYVGVQYSGEAALSNYYGVHLIDCQENRVGGTNANERNVISGNSFFGVLIQAVHLFSQSNTVQGNLIGLAASATQFVANVNGGVRIGNSSNNVVGGSATAAGNYICGGGSGVSIDGLKARRNRIQANRIGLNPASGIFSNYMGVEIHDAPLNLIGGSTAASEGNVISGNDYYGLRLWGSNCFENVVEGNSIGTDATETNARPNRYTGVDVSSGAWSNRIGGTSASTFNVIAGNGGGGIVFRDADTHHNTAGYNFIGMNRAFLALSNGNYGVEIYQAASNYVGPGNYIGNHPGSGIRIGATNAAGNVVQGNIVGVDFFGNRHPNYSGIEVQDAQGTQIGGTNAAQRNYVQGNRSDGVNIFGLASNTLVVGNWIGPDFSGFAAVSNNGSGIRIAAPWTIVGATNAGARNVISGNGQSGVAIGTGGSNSVVVGNYIGTDANGLNPVPNAYDGIEVREADCRVGGITTNHRNIISGNYGSGVSIDAPNVRVAGNFIGLNANGTAALTNGGEGIYVLKPFATIGATNPAGRNVISGNGRNGIYVSSGGTNATIVNNYIGLDAAGTGRLANASSGIALSANDSTVGGKTANHRNVLTGNGNIGLALDGVTNAVIQGNYIGVTAGGFGVFSNYYGILLQNSAGNAIGGTNAGEGNVISGNYVNNVVLGDGANSNRVEGNYIGPDAGGSTGFSAPIYGGLRIEGGRGNWIARNTLSGNGYGIEIKATGSVNNVMAGNVIGMNSIKLGPLSNRLAGIWIYNAPGNRIGGPLPGDGNVICHNRQGILLESTGAVAGTVGTIIQGNTIGGYPFSLSPTVGNAQEGILIQGARQTLVGGLATNEANLISYNALGGVLVTSTAASAVGNALLGNAIYSNAAPALLGIDLDPLGPTVNDALDADLGPNGLQNFPVLTNAWRSGTLVHLQGLFASAPLQSYRLEFFASDRPGPEGKEFLGRTTVTTDGAGQSPFYAAVYYAGATVRVVNATATALAGSDTSEFGAGLGPVPVLAAADSDNDGIPDFWESLYGLNPAVSNAPGSDLDNDGVSDLGEYLADTPANNPAAFLAITVFSNRPTALVGFPSSSARTYDLEFTSNLLAGAWTMLVTNQPGNGALLTLPDPAAAPPRAYRVQAALP